MIDTRFLFVAISVAFSSLPAFAQEEEEQQLGWTNVADLSIVVTTGNSSTSTFAVDDKLGRKWTSSELGFRFGLLRTQTTDERFAVGMPDDFDVIEDLTRELDNERYYVSGQYQRNISSNLFWLAGGGWDKDSNAGIENRTVLFGGVGNTWRDTEQTSFKTDYAVTFTKRVDEIQDPTRDETFSEARLASDFQQKLNASNRIDSNFVFFLNVSDASDYRFDTINSFTANMNSIFALRFSIQFLYQNFPALQEIDLQNVNGLPLGEVVVRKKKLDTVLKFSFLVTL